MENIISWIEADPKTRLALLAAAISIFSIIAAGFFNILVWPMLKNGLEKIWDLLRSGVSTKRFEALYLDSMINEHKHLPILPTTLVPVTNVKQQELDKMYVSLEVSQNSLGVSHDLSADLVLKENRLIILLGDPGAGKTTLLRFLALSFARARRNTPLSKTSHERSSERVKIKEARIRVHKEFGCNSYPLPVFVYLNRFRDIESWDQNTTLLDAHHSKLISIPLLQKLPSDFFETRYKKGDCVFLFDAFDELGTQQSRNAIARRIGEFAASAPIGNRFIVTSRIVGYEGQLSSYGFAVYKIQKLSWKLITQLITRWYDSLNEKELANQLLSTLQSNVRVKELASNPMLLSLIVLVQYVKRVIPDRRHVLYDECIKILIERRFAPPEVQKQYNSVLPDNEAIMFVREIATYMHENHLREIPRQNLLSKVIPDIQKKMFGGFSKETEPLNILKNIEERSQLIIERGINDSGQPVMAFSHLTFQEYLVALSFKELTSHLGETLISKRLITNYTKDREWWEEVALLYAAQLDGNQREPFFAQLVTIPETSNKDQRGD